MLESRMARAPGSVGLACACLLWLASAVGAETMDSLVARARALARSPDLQLRLKAARDLQEAARLAPERADVWWELSALQASFFEREQARASLEHLAKITPDVVLVSIGAKSEALMDLHELDGEKVGDRIEAVVIKAGPDVRLSRKLAAGRRTKAELRAEIDELHTATKKALAKKK